MPGPVQPLLLIAYGAIGVAGVLAWTGPAPRSDVRRPVVCGCRALSLSLAVLRRPGACSSGPPCAAPSRRSSTAGLPRASGRSGWPRSAWPEPITSFPGPPASCSPPMTCASLGFWALLFVGGWTGGRHLIGGPAPAWISTIAIVASVLLLFHYIDRLPQSARRRTAAAGRRSSSSPSGCRPMSLGGFLDALTAMRGGRRRDRSSPFSTRPSTARASTAGFPCCSSAALYFALPRITGPALGLRRPGPRPLGPDRGRSPPLGPQPRGRRLSAGPGPQRPHGRLRGASPPDTRPWLLGATAAQALLLLGNLLLP